MELTVENIRCFAGRHVVPIKPLTLLIGENSSGKSTLLAVLSAASDPSGFPFRPRLNEVPYSLGGFSSIVSRGGAPAQRSQAKHGSPPSFSIGFLKEDSGPRPAEVRATYQGDRGETVLEDLKIQSQDGEAFVKRDVSGGYTVNLATKENSKYLTYSVDPVIAGEPDFDSRDILLKSVYSRTENSLMYPGAYLIVRKIFDHVSLAPALSLAPIRTKPRRTYEKVADDFSPEGAHIPFLLWKILDENADSESKRALLKSLRRFGNESGLFSDIAIRGLGDVPGDPFQVMVTVGRRQVNLLDVGYGVSQVLPIVVQAVLAANERTLLVQQPEVHLHPRAQAALGSLFVDIVSKADKRLVLETHSDYIIDRIRQDIASGRIPAEDVVFLYLERKGLVTKVFPMATDELGNLNGAPPSYRAFFLRETMNLLSRGD